MIERTAKENKTAGDMAMKTPPIMLLTTVGRDSTENWEQILLSLCTEKRPQLKEQIVLKEPALELHQMESSVGGRG